MSIVRIIEGVYLSRDGVLVDPPALNHDPQVLRTAVALGHKHFDDGILKEAWHGASGPLYGKSCVDYVEYLQIKEECEAQRRIEIATYEAKRRVMRKRRSEFRGVRTELVLMMLNSGVPYKCAVEGCLVCDDLAVDHIHPLSLGGSDDITNVQFLCTSHNSQKGSTT